MNLEGKLFVRGNGSRSPVYPIVLKGMSFETNETATLLDVIMEDDCLKFFGGRTALQNLAHGLINYFADQPCVNDHFHLDFFEGNSILNPTNYSLVFMCNNR